MKNYVLMLLLIIGSFSIATGQSQAVSQSPSFGLNSYFSYLMMEPNQNLRKVKLLVDSKSEGLIKDKSLSLGFSICGLLDYQKTNQDSKFGYLMRHPTATNQIGKHVSEATLHSATLGLTASLNSWITAYGELLYDPQQSFGTGTITSLTRNQIQLRKGFVVLGNTLKFPFYFSMGKADTPFGQTGSVSPFTNSTMWHAFGGLAFQALLGFDKYGINASFALVQGGAQFRAANVPVDSTSVPSRLNNFVADLNYKLSISNNFEVQIGGSYIKGCAYCQEWPVTHFMPCSENNPAFTFYGNIMIANRLYLKGGFASTLEVWPGTFNPAPPLNEFEASKVSSLDYGGIFQINPNGKYVFSLSGEFSNFVSGPDGSPWERQNQLVVGLNAQVEETSRFFIEFVKVDGYVPLNFISGGNFPDPGVTHSANDTRTLAFIAGVFLSI